MLKIEQEGVPVWLSQLGVLTSAQVMISWFVGSGPAVRLNAISTEPAWDPLSPSLCPSSVHALSFSLSLSIINKR